MFHCSKSPPNNYTEIVFIQHLCLFETDPFPGITGKGTNILQIWPSSYHVSSFLLSLESNHVTKTTMFHITAITANMRSWMKMKCLDCNRHVQSVIYSISIHFTWAKSDRFKIITPWNDLWVRLCAFMWVLLWIMWTHYTTTYKLEQSVSVKL